MQRKTLDQFRDVRQPSYQQTDPDLLVCNKCGCHWFEQLQAEQYDKMHNVILGQRVPAKGQTSFCLLRCVKCSNLLEPNVQVGPQDTMRKAYDNMLDEVESTLPPLNIIRPR